MNNREPEGPARFIDPLRVGWAPLDAERHHGPLDGIALAIKDVIDFAGVSTGAGNPTFLASAAPAREHATAVSRLLDAGAQALGKAHTDELAFSLSGTNAHYGTPRNPAAPGRVPGGSSSGSAAAVASGLAQIALGTDTAGSIRVPASYCGVHGLRPSHARVPLAGVLPLAPSFDTCGLLAASGELLEQAALCLLRSKPAEPPRALVVGTDLMAEADAPVAAAVLLAADRLASMLAVPLLTAELASERRREWMTAFRDRQLVEAWQAHGHWIETCRPDLGPGVAARFAAARTTPEGKASAAALAHVEVREALERVLPDGGALVLPSAATVAPRPTESKPSKESLRQRTVALTCIAGLAGAPALSLPLAAVDSRPVGVCLLARPGEDERLLAAARIATAR